MEEPIYDTIRNSLVDGKLPEDFRLSKESSNGLYLADGLIDGVTLYHQEQSSTLSGEQALLCMYRLSVTNKADEDIFINSKNTKVGGKSMSDGPYLGPIACDGKPHEIELQYSREQLEMFHAERDDVEGELVVYFNTLDGNTKSYPLIIQGV